MLNHKFRSRRPTLRAALGWALAGLVTVAKADGTEVVDANALRSAVAPQVQPIPAGVVAARFGAAPWDTAAKVQQFRSAVVALEPLFFQGTPGGSPPNKAAHLADGRDVLLLSGCRNGFQCDQTAYAMVYDATHGTVGIVERTPQPDRYRVLMRRDDPALRNLLFALASIVLHAPDGARGGVHSSSATSTASQQLVGVTFLPQGPIDATYGDLANGLDTHPDVAGAIRRANNIFLLPDTVCGVRLSDGRKFLLISATTSNADGAVPYAIAYSASSRIAFVYRSPSDQGGAEAFFGNPDSLLRPVLSAVAQNCLNMRAQMGLDANGADTGTPTPSPASTPTRDAGRPECRTKDGGKLVEVLVDWNAGREGEPRPGSLRTSSNGSPSVRPLQVSINRGLIELYPGGASLAGKAMGIISCAGDEMFGNPVGNGCSGGHKKVLQFAVTSAAGWSPALPCE